MLTISEREHIREVLKDGLGINPDTNFNYYLNSMNSNKMDIDTIKAQIDLIISNQRTLDRKLDKIINLICGQ